MCINNRKWQAQTGILAQVSQVRLGEVCMCTRNPNKRKTPHCFKSSGTTHIMIQHDFIEDLNPHPHCWQNLKSHELSVLYTQVICLVIHMGSVLQLLIQNRASINLEGGRSTIIFLQINKLYRKREEVETTKRHDN